MLLDELYSWIEASLRPWAREHGVIRLPPFVVEEPPVGIEADVACNLALLLAKSLKQNPRELAQELRGILKSQSGIAEPIGVAGAGFINFRWSTQRLQKEVQTILQQGDAYGRLENGRQAKILIEFVSANPTGPLHVGHGRGAALGDSLALILTHLGYAVSREYYVNDAGQQVQLLAESVRARCQELAGQQAAIPEEGYHGDYVREIAREYVKTHSNGSRDDLSTLLAFSLRQMQKGIEKDLEDFGVCFDTWFSEASLVREGAVEKRVQALRERGYVQDHEEAVWFVAPGDVEAEKDKNRVLRRRDGRWTYFATDVAYHADKFERGFDRLIDVWGADHHGYAPRVTGSLQALGYDPKRLHIVLYQLVALKRGGVPVSMSKRSGDFITLREVLEEVGRDACRFFFALRGPNTALEFDLELAKRHTAENPVYYVQYAHARICSIFRQVDAPKKGSDPTVDLSLLKEKEETELMKRLAHFPQTLRTCAQEDSPHPLANYLLTLCRQFHYFYDNHRVLNDDPLLTSARLSLCAAVRQILRLGLDLLGVSAPEKM